MSDRHVLTAQDPLATVHPFQVVMRVVLPSLFGMRMCVSCPHCSFDEADSDAHSKAVQCSN
eukprot:11202964-Karenia_brevis.AAC.1